MEISLEAKPPAKKWVSHGNLKMFFGNKQTSF